MANRNPLRWVPAIVAGLLLPLLLSTRMPFAHGQSPQPTDGAPRRSSSAIALTADGATLVVVNPDSNSVTLVDTATHTPLAEIGVGVDPRTVAVDAAGSRAYVANRGSDAVSVIDLGAQSVVTHVAVGRRPYGVALSTDDQHLYVAEQGADQVRVLDAGSLTTLSLIPTVDRPSGLVVPDDRTVYVTHLLTRTVTALTVQPFTVYLPSILREGTGLRSGSIAAGPVALHLATSIPLWPDSNLVQSIVLAPDGNRIYVPHSRSDAGNPNLTFETTVIPVVSQIDPATRQHLVGEHFDLGSLDPPGVGLPFDAAVAPDGSTLWVVNAASNDLSVIDLATGELAAHVEVDHNPRGIALSPDGATAYVNNTLAGTVSVVDTTAYTVTGAITVTHIPLPPVLLNGKRLFHTSDDPRLSQDQWISCNSCHFEGEHDGRTWQFAFSGPRNTTSLLGMIETYPLRWSGEWDESADSEFANVQENFGGGLIDGEMNCSLSPPDCVNHPPNQGRSYDLDCLAAFIDALQIPLSPHHAHGEPLTAAEARGQALFEAPDLGCVDCHPAPLYTDLQMHDVGTATADERIGPAYDTPSLRGLYDSAPYFHDGSAATLYDALIRPTPGGEHDVTGLLTEDQIADLVAFLMALPFE